MATATKKATNANGVMELSQKTADVVLEGTVKTMELGNEYFQNLVKVGLDAQNAGIGITRTYFDNLAEVQKSWISLFASNGEKAIKAVGDMGANVQEKINNVTEKVSEKVEETAKTATK